MRNYLFALVGLFIISSCTISSCTPVSNDASAASSGLTDDTVSPSTQTMVYANQEFESVIKAFPIAPCEPKKYDSSGAIIIDFEFYSQRNKNARLTSLNGSSGSGGWDDNYRDYIEKPMFGYEDVDELKAQAKWGKLLPLARALNCQD